jgi:hypothetical protein
VDEDPHIGTPSAHGGAPPLASLNAWMKIRTSALLLPTGGALLACLTAWMQIRTSALLLPTGGALPLASLNGIRPMPVRGHVPCHAIVIIENKLLILPVRAERSRLREYDGFQFGLDGRETGR